MSNLVCSKCRLPATGAFCSRCGGSTKPVSSSNENPSSYSRPGQGSPNFVSSPSVSSSSMQNGNTQAAMWCHLAPLLIGVLSALTSLFGIGLFLALFAWLPPVIINANFKHDDFVRRHAHESINFQLFWLIAGVVLGIFYAVFGFLTLGIGWIALGVIFVIFILPLAIFYLVVMIRASIDASSGRPYRYPLVLFRIVR